MFSPFASSALQRHRVEDERGLHYSWSSYPDLLAAVEMVAARQPGEHAPDPAQALQDAFSLALHQAQAVQVDARDRASAGEHEWTGAPLWLEFDTPQTFGGPASYEGALVFQLPLGASRLVIPVLMGQGAEWPLPFVLSGPLLGQLAALTAGAPDRAGQALAQVLCALTHVPPLPEVPPQHEGTPTLLARLERHLKRVRTLAPQTTARLPRLYLKERHTWDPRTFVPTPLTAALLHTLDGLDEQAALLAATEVTVINAWRYAKHVVRIDEDVLASLRRSRPLTRLPHELPGLRGHAVYVPVPGGLSHPSQTGFFAAIDDIEGQPWLILLIEARAYGDHVLAPVALPLGAEIETALLAMTETGSTNFTAAEAARVTADLGLALLCVAYLGSPKTQLLGPGQPQPVTPRRGKGGKEELVEPGHTPVWEAGVDTGNQLRAYRAGAGRPSGEAGEPTGRTVAPHLRQPHLHGYWVGEGRRRFELKFLDFIPVNFDERGGEAPVRLEE